jgi:hypothetical protein
MYAENNDFPDRPDALPLDLIWGFETTSNSMKYIDLYANICHNEMKAIGQLRGDFVKRAPARAIA